MKPRILTIIVSLIIFAQSAFSQNTELTIRLNKFGEATIFERITPNNTTEDSLANIAYGMGAMQWRLDPITMMLGTLYTSDHNQFLNKAAIDALLASNDPKFSAITAGIGKGFRNVDPDGTIETTIPGHATIEQIQNLLRRFKIREAAESQTYSVNPNTLRIVTRWLEGAQSAAAQGAAAFYAAHPELQSTNIINYFVNLDVVDILEGYAWISIVYDLGSINNIIGGFGAAGWLQSAPLGQQINQNLNQNVSSSSIIDLAEFHRKRALPIGASNGAAFVYVPQTNPTDKICVVAGEPHQTSTYDIPGGPLQQQKLFRAYVKNEAGMYQPLFASVYPTLPAFAGIHATEFSATSGTAAPTGGSLMFVTPTNGVA